MLTTSWSFTRGSTSPRVEGARTASRALGVIASSLAMLLLACSSEPPVDTDTTRTPSMPIARAPACEPPTPVRYPIVVAQTVTAGYVEVANSCSALTFTAHLDEPLATTPAGHDYSFSVIAIDVQDVVPPVRKPPGQFEYQYAYPTPSRTEFSQTIPFSAFGLADDVCADGSCGSELSIMFHLAILERLPGGMEAHQTGWSGDQPFTGKSWGYYMTFTPCCTCDADPAPELTATCGGALHYTATGATCQWTFEQDGAVIGSSDTCAGDLDVSLPAGTVVEATVHVTSAEGCAGDATTSVTTRAPIAVAVTGSDLACAGGGNTGEATAAASGGSGGYTYLWSPGGETTPALSGLAPGTYSVVVSDTAGCSAQGSVTIAEPAPLEVAISSENVACSGGASASATATPTGGTAPYAYLWSNGAVTAAVTSLAAGDYTVSVTDARGCTAQASATIGEPTSVAVEITADNVECAGGASGNATAVPSGGIGPYTFVWSTGATGATLAGVPAGDYSVTVTDANGCPAQASVSITQPPAMAVEITADGVECAGGASGNATAVPSGGVGPYTFLWSTGATGASLAGVPAGDYSVTVTDANGCPAQASVTIGEPLAMSVAITSDDVECAGGASGNATAVPGGGVGPYSFLWSNGATGDTLAGVPAGDYSVSVTDANGCPAQASVTITQPAAMSVAITSDDVECAGGASGNATAVPSGGVGPYSFLWSTGATGPSLLGVPAGDYSVAVTDANGCPAQASVTIGEATAMSIELLADGVECAGGASGNVTAVPHGGVGPYAFVWSNGATGPALNGVPAGDYSVTVTDANGCPAQASVSISEPPALSVAITSDDVECAGGASGNATAVPSGGVGPYTFLWSNGATGDTLAGVPAGDYSVSIADANGCPAQASVSITEPPALTASVDASTSCGGLRYEATADGGAAPLATVVTVTGPGGFSEQYAALTGEVATGVEGAYTVTVSITDANGCPASATDAVDVFDTLAVIVEAQGSCPADGDLYFTYGASVVGGSGALAYTWTLHGDGAITGSVPPVEDATTAGTATVSLPGSYYAELTVVDAATGCVAAGSTSARVFEPLRVTLAASAGALQCPMDTDAISFAAQVSGGSGNYLLSWAGAQPGDTCLDGTTTCLIDGNGFCDSRSITATVIDAEAASCASVTSAAAIYEKTTTVSATAF